MDFLFAGAGAVGSSLGGFLKKAGHRVALLGRSAHMEAIRNQGLHITGLWGEHRVRGFETTTSISAVRGPFDAIFVSVKSYDTLLMARAISPLLLPGTLLVSVQNGLGNTDALAEATRHPLILGGRVIYGSEIPGPGRVNITVYTQPVLIGFSGPFVPAPESGALQKAGVLASVVAEAGIPCEYTEEIEKHLWAKLFYSCALNPLGAIHRVPYGALGEKPEWRGIMEAVVCEAFAVARARKAPLLWENSSDYLDLFYSKLLPDTRHHRSSMLQDLERGRKTEIDSLNGILVRYARETGVPVPVNESLTEQIQRLEKTK